MWMGEVEWIEDEQQQVVEGTLRPAQDVYMQSYSDGVWMESFDSYPVEDIYIEYNNSIHHNHTLQYRMLLHFLLPLSHLLLVDALFDFPSVLFVHSMMSIVVVAVCCSDSGMLSVMYVCWCHPLTHTVSHYLQLITTARHQIHESISINQHRRPSTHSLFILWFVSPYVHFQRRCQISHEGFEFQIFVPDFTVIEVICHPIPVSRHPLLMCV